MSEERLKPNNFLSLTELLSAMDLFVNRSGAKNKKLAPEQELNEEFSWINVATTNIPVGEVLGVIEKYNLSPWIPRSAHLGGVYYNIARGGGGSVALNKPIFDDGYGHPLVLDLNETPDIARKGDTSYWPGTIFDDRGHQDLPLYTWNGSNFERRDRSCPLFVPLVMTEESDGRLVPLVSVHREDMNLRGKFEFQYLSVELLKNEPFVREILYRLLELVKSENDPGVQKKLSSLIANRVVNLSGVSFHKPLDYSSSNGNFKIGNREYSSIEEVVDLLLLPLKISANPQWLSENINQWPQELPRLSKEMIIALVAVLNTNFYEQYNKPLKPVNPHFHLHWGAFQMTGAPPLFNGYFASSASGIRNLLSAMRRGFRDSIPPVYYVLLPAAIFTLFPSAGHQTDINAVNKLIDEVRSASNQFFNKPKSLKDSIERVVRNWWDEYNSSLSLYFISRFSQYDSSKTAHVPEDPRLVKPEGFYELTFRQASYLVGFLKKIVQ